MKLPDSEPLAADEYWIIADQWKQEWERGVQVPVNPDSLPEPSVATLQETYFKKRQDFKLYVLRQSPWRRLRPPLTFHVYRFSSALS